ncbi:MAG: MOSC domain-containing protein [Campylobacterota bacterium]|nr:MOSC domain-containing protein [Campylobacterota bacterium]
MFISKDGYKERISKDELELNSLGVVEDKFYNKNIQRSVLLTSQDSYNLIKINNIDVDYGILGENLLLDFNPYDLDIGTKLQIGEVELEISQACTICSHLSSIDKTLPSLLKKDRGIFSKVIKDGKIEIDDEIYLVG